MHRLYHPGLGREITVPTDRSRRVLEESGWRPAPTAATAEPGKEPDPVRYEPVTAKPSKTAAKAAKPKTEEA